MTESPAPSNRSDDADPPVGAGLPVALVSLLLVILFFVATHANGQ